MQFKFVHAADIHLDSPLTGLVRYEGAPVQSLRGATREAFTNLIDFCIEQEVSFLLIAGDLYDGDWRDYNTGLFFAAQMTRLRKAGIDVFIVRGNHDAASQITHHLKLPDNVYQFSIDQPETYLLKELGVAIHGYSFPQQSVKEDLTLYYPEASEGLLNIGLLHTSADGREGHDNYAPCNLNHLLNKGYDYWALGHVHQREIISEEPWIVYPGNIQGRHIREQGDKGCTLVTVTERQVERVEHRDLDVVKWMLFNIDVSNLKDCDSILTKVTSELENQLNLLPDKLLAVRLVLTGACPAHLELQNNKMDFTNNLKAAVTDLSYGEIWVEKVKLQTTGFADRNSFFEEHPSLTDFFRIFNEVCDDASVQEDLLAKFNYLKSYLPTECFQGEDRLEFTNEYFKEKMATAEQIILARLLAKESDE